MEIAISYRGNCHTLLVLRINISRDLKVDHNLFFNSDTVLVILFPWLLFVMRNAAAVEDGNSVWLTLRMSQSMVTVTMMVTGAGARALITPRC